METRSFSLRWDTSIDFPMGLQSDSHNTHVSASPPFQVTCKGYSKAVTCEVVRMLNENSELYSHHHQTDLDLYPNRCCIDMDSITDRLDLTREVLYSTTPDGIRLAGIDCPKKGQPYDNCERGGNSRKREGDECSGAIVYSLRQMLFLQSPFLRESRACHRLAS